MGQFRTIKKEAKRLLKGHRMRGVLVVLWVAASEFLGGLLETVLRVASGVPAFFKPPAPLLSLRNASVHSVLISLLTFLLGFLLTSIVWQGAFRWCVQLVRGEAPKCSVIFHFFEKPSRWCKAIGLRLAIWCHMAGYVILLALPPVGILWMMYAVYTPTFRTEHLGRIEPFLWLVIALWILLSFLLLSVAAMRYFPAFFLLAESPSLTIAKVLRKSRRMMVGEKGNALLLLLSFMGWFSPLMLAVAAVLCSFVWDFSWYGIGLLEVSGLLVVAQALLLLYQLPYFAVSYQQFTELISARETELTDFKTKEYLYHAQLDELLSQDGFRLDYKLNIPPSASQPALEPEGEQIRGWPAADGGIS